MGEVGTRWKGLGEIGRREGRQERPSRNSQSALLDFVLDNERGREYHNGVSLSGVSLAEGGGAGSVRPLRRILKGVFFLEKGIVHTSIERLAGYMIDLPAAERQGIAAALACIDGMPEEEKEKALFALQKAISPRVRAIKCHKMDVNKRTIVGARVNRELAALCRDAARRRGQSLNAWCRAAIWNALLQQDRARTISSAATDGATTT